jgi:plastocyanin
MKYAISLFMVLALIGAGCTETPVPTITEDPETSPLLEETIEESEDAMEDNNEEETTEEEVTKIEEETDDTTTEVSTDDGTTITIDTGDEASGQTTGDTDNEEISNIVLGGAPNVTISMTTGNFFFTPNTITAAPGDRILIDFVSNSGTHDFVIDELNVDYDIEEGGNYVFTVPDEPGTYTYYCSIGSHRAMGMEGTLIIE